MVVCTLVATESTHAPAITQSSVTKNMLSVKALVTCQAKLEGSLTSCQSPMDPLLIQPRGDDKTGNNGTYCIDSNDRWLQTLPRHSEMVVPQDQAYGQRPHKNFKSFEA